MELNDDIDIDLLNEDPLIFSIDNFITKEECQHIINLSKLNLQDALVSDDNKGKKYSGRTGSVYWMSIESDHIVKNIAIKISDLVKLPLEHCETFQVVHYKINERYNSHYDAYLNDNSPKSIRCMKYGGQRLVTTLLYLNNVEKGGSTCFPTLKIESQPKQGKLLVFNNCLKDSIELDTRTLHGGSPVELGEKYAVNLWFRERNTKIINT